MPLPPALTDLRRVLHGAPLRLPPALDRASERWARARPRTRLAVGLLAGLLVLVGPAVRTVASPWGAPVDVIVAARDLPAGHVLAGDDLTTVAWPTQLAPAQTDVAAGARLRHGLPRGAAVLADHVATGDIATALPPDRVATALPATDLPPLLVGDRLDLHAPDVGVIRDAEVLSIGQDTVWISVARSDAGLLAAGRARGGLTVALLSAGSRAR